MPLLWNISYVFKKLPTCRIELSNIYLEMESDKDLAELIGESTLGI